jgi:ABC-type transport system involved in multi-copper enzyme maturation permease subunit
MKALIIKDMLNLKGQYKMIFGILVFYAVLSLSSSDANFLFGMISIILTLLTITSISYDERSKWDKYALTMPISRQDIVISKYLLGLILALVALALNLVFVVLLSDLPVKESIATAFALFGISLLFLSFMLPALFKYGVEKGRFIMLLIFFVPTAIVIIASKLDIIEMISDIISNIPVFQLISVLIILLMIIVAISIMASIRIYKNKEM